MSLAADFERWEREYEAEQERYVAERPYPCEEKHCTKRFKNKTGLYAHKRTHTKPRVCEECKKRFSQKYLLKTHIRLLTGERIYGPCGRCGGMSFHARDIVNFTAYYKELVKSGEKKDVGELVCFPCAARQTFGRVSCESKTEISK